MNNISSDTQKIGKIKWFNNNKGYGFITGDDGEEAFLHYSVIKNLDKVKIINEMDPVIYETQLDSRGIMAINVYLQNELSIETEDNLVSKENIPTSPNVLEIERYIEEINNLKQLLIQRSIELNNSRMVKGLLADCIVNNKALRHILVCLYDEDVVMKLGSEEEKNIEKYKLQKIMTEQYGFNEKYVEMGITIWDNIVNEIKLGGERS